MTTNVARQRTMLSFEDEFKVFELGVKRNRDPTVWLKERSDVRIVSQNKDFQL